MELSIIRQFLWVILVGSIAIVFGTNTTISVKDILTDSSQVVQVRGEKPFQPSRPDDLKNEGDRRVGVQPQPQPTSILLDGIDNNDDIISQDEDKGKRRRTIHLGQSLQVGSFQKDISGRQEIEDANNTIAVAGSGHYDQQLVHAFVPTYGHEAPHHHHPPPPHHKPLKPSVVHRDPHAHFDPHDAVRTQDYDRQHQVYPSAYHKHVGGYGDHHHHHNSLYGHAYGYEHHKLYHYNPNLTPECSHKNRYYYNLTFCLEDSHYPTETILWAIRQSGHGAERLFSDVTYQSADNLVDGLTRAEEEGYTYDHYFGASHHQHHNLDQYKPPYHGYTYSNEYYKTGGYICPSDVFYARPRRAMNTYGRWKIIVNLDYLPKGGYDHDHHYEHKHKAFTQTLRLEQCIYANAPCSYIDSHIYSRCLQKHNFVRLVAWTYEEGLHIDTFKMPISCSCHIQPVHFYQPHSHHHHVPLTPVHTVAVGHQEHGTYGK